MGIRMHIFTARDLIHLRQSRPSGHGITDREGGWVVLRRGQHLSGKKSVSPLGAGCPGHRGPVPLARGKERARVTSRKPCGGPGTRAALAQSKALGQVSPPLEMGFDCDTCRVSLYLRREGTRRAPYGAIRSPRSVAFPGCAFHLFPGGDLGRLGGKRGQRISGQVLGVPEGHLGEAVSRKEEGGNVPRFPVGFPHRALPGAFGNETRPERGGIAAADPGRARPNTPAPGWGLCGVVPAPSAPAGRAPAVSRILPAPRKEKCPRSASSRPLRQPPPVPLG